MKKLLTTLLAALGIRPEAHAQAPSQTLDRRQTELNPERLFVVSVGEREISVQKPDGRIEAMPIADLREVAIVTNDSGPVGADVWWLLAGKEARSDCAFPGGSAGERDVLQFVQQLPGFDNIRFIEAMGSTSNAKFVCWSAEA